MKRILGLVVLGCLITETAFGTITWTKSWSSADDGTTFGGSDIEDIQNDISSQAQTTSSDYVVGPATNTDSYVPQWDGVNSKILKNGVALSSLTSKIVQVVNYQTGAVATGNTAMVYDDSIPEKTEGDEYMTLAITPTSATNKLKIDIVFQGSVSVSGGDLIVALFQDTTTNALAAVSTGEFATASDSFAINFSHYMTAGTTSATTFKIRAGASGTPTTITFNGLVAGRKLGGVMASSITITEITA